MGLLPNSRNTTYGSDSAVKSADLDDIQDCIADSKHPEHHRPFGPTAWESISGAGGVVSDEWTFTADVTLACDLSGAFRAGERITTIDFGYDRGTSASSIGFALENRPIDGSATWSVVAISAGTTPDGVSAGHHTNTLTWNHVMLDGYYYRLIVNFNSGGVGPWTGLEFYGSDVKADAL